MSIDRSLKIKGALARHRNVLSRAERIDALKEEQKWTEEQGVFGLPKVAHRKVHTVKEKVEKPEEAAAAGPEVAGAAAPAAGKAGAAPKAGAAGAAPKAGASPKAGAAPKTGAAPKAGAAKPAKK
ncbi:MAG: small basic protein [Phycisphaerae bacterium]|jgi:small basic protein (TIGR04137 family)